MAAATVVVVVANRGGPPSASHTLRGTITVFDGKSFAGDGDCPGGGSGTDDLRTGAQVRVVDGSEGLLGVGAFGPGRRTGRGGCALPFTVRSLPDAAFYEIRTGAGTRRGEAYLARRLARDGWRLALTVGDEQAAALDSHADCLETETVTVSAVTFARVRDDPQTAFITENFEASATLTNTSDKSVEVSASWVADEYLDSLEAENEGIGPAVIGPGQEFMAHSGLDAWNQRPGPVRVEVDLVARPGKLCLPF